MRRLIWYKLRSRWSSGWWFLHMRGSVAGNSGWNNLPLKKVWILSMAKSKFSQHWCLIFFSGVHNLFLEQLDGPCTFKPWWLLYFLLTLMESMSWNAWLYIYSFWFDDGAVTPMICMEYMRLQTSGCTNSQLKVQISTQGSIVKTPESLVIFLGDGATGPPKEFRIWCMSLWEPPKLFCSKPSRSDQVHVQHTPLVSAFLYISSFSTPTTWQSSCHGCFVSPLNDHIGSSFEKNSTTQSKNNSDIQEP